MATDKRDRQRANRDLKRAEEAKKAKTRHRIALVRKYVWYAVIFAFAIFALTIFFD